MNNVQIIFSTMKVQAINSFTRPMFKYSLIVNPLLNTILILEMFRSKLTEGNVEATVFGVVIMTLWYCLCFSSVSDISRERWNGTLPILFLIPINFNFILCAKFLGNLFLSGLSSIISVSTAIFLFGIRIKIEQPIYFAVSTVALILSFTLFSMCFAYLLLLSRKTTLYMNILDLPITIFCGFVFPLHVLPIPMQLFGNILLPTWAVRLLNLSLKENFSKDLFLVTFVFFFVITLIYLVFICVLWIVIKKKIYVKGSLEVS